MLHRFIFPEWKDDGCSWELSSQQGIHVNFNFRKFRE